MSGIGTLLGVAAALVSASAGANTQTFQGTACGSSSCNGNMFSSNLALPANITFNDNPLSTGTTTDDWYFGVGTSSLGTTITGDQINLTNFTVTGTVDTFQLWTTNGYGGMPTSMISQGTVTGPFSQYILDPTVTGGYYALVVQSTVNPGSIGNYTGSIVIATPLPASAWLLVSALGCLGFLITRQRPSTLATA